MSLLGPRIWKLDPYLIPKIIWARRYKVLDLGTKSPSPKSFQFLLRLKYSLIAPFDTEADKVRMHFNVLRKKVSISAAKIDDTFCILILLKNTFGLNGHERMFANPLNIRIQIFKICRLIQELLQPSKMGSLVLKDFGGAFQQLKERWNQAERLPERHFS